MALFCCAVLLAPARASAADAWKNLFGCVSFKMALKDSSKWLDVLKRNGSNPIFQAARVLARGTTWSDLRQKASGGDVLKALKVVNSFWNGWPYKDDRDAYGRADYWAAPFEFLRHSGDCEDYSIAKYFTLKELGVPVDDMRIIVVREMIRGIGHAVLAVRAGDEIYLLDNLAENVRSARRVRNYAPQYSVNEKNRWMYVKPR